MDAKKRGSLSDSCRTRLLGKSLPILPSILQIQIVLQCHPRKNKDVFAYYNTINMDIYIYIHIIYRYTLVNFGVVTFFSCSDKAMATTTSDSFDLVRLLHKEPGAIQAD